MSLRMRRKAGALDPDSVTMALKIAERLEPSGDWPFPAVDLSQAERRLLQSLIYAAANAALERPRDRRKHRDRDFWIAVDFHTRTGRDRAKAVARAWGLNPRQVATIASRGRDAVNNSLKLRETRFWRAVLAMQKKRLLQLTNAS